MPDKLTPDELKAIRARLFEASTHGGLLPRAAETKALCDTVQALEEELAAAQAQVGALRVTGQRLAFAVQRHMTASEMYAVSMHTAKLAKALYEYQQALSDLSDIDGRCD